MKLESDPENHSTTNQLSHFPAVSLEQHLFGELYTAHMAETGKDLLWPAPVSAVGSVSGR